MYDIPQQGEIQRVNTQQKCFAGSRDPVPTTLPKVHIAPG